MFGFFFASFLFFSFCVPLVLIIISLYPEEVISMKRKKYCLLSLIMLAKFNSVEYLLPFPQFAVSIKPDLKHLLTILDSMWEMPTFNCCLNFTNTSLQGFDVNWLLSEVKKEVAASEQALCALQHEIAFLQPPYPSSSHADRPVEPCL